MSSRKRHTREGMLELYKKANRHVGNSPLQECIWFYRNKPDRYFDKIMQYCQGNMSPIVKDMGGDPGNPINGRLAGVFFSASSLLPQRSPYGRKRFLVRSSLVMGENCRLFFSDFFCNNPKIHHIQVVLVPAHQVAHLPVLQELIELDLRTNNYIKRESDRVLVTNRPGLWIEVFYTSPINIPDMISRNLAFFRITGIIGRGTSTPGGIPKNARCTICNVNKNLSTMSTTPVLWDIPAAMRVDIPSRCGITNDTSHKGTKEQPQGGRFTIAGFSGVRHGLNKEEGSQIDSGLSGSREATPSDEAHTRNRPRSMERTTGENLSNMSAYISQSEDRNGRALGSQDVVAGYLSQYGTRPKVYEIDPINQTKNREEALSQQSVGETRLLHRKLDLLRESPYSRSLYHSQSDIHSCESGNPSASKMCRSPSVASSSSSASRSETKGCGSFRNMSGLATTKSNQNEHAGKSTIQEASATSSGPDKWAYLTGRVPFTSTPQDDPARSGCNEARSVQARFKAQEGISHSLRQQIIRSKAELPVSWFSNLTQVTHSGDKRVHTEDSRRTVDPPGTPLNYNLTQYLDNKPGVPSSCQSRYTQAGSWNHRSKIEDTTDKVYKTQTSRPTRVNNITQESYDTCDKTARSSEQNVYTAFDKGERKNEKHVEKKIKKPSRRAIDECATQLDALAKRLEELEELLSRIEAIRTKYIR